MYINAAETKLPSMNQLRSNEQTPMPDWSYTAFGSTNWKCHINVYGVSLQETR